MPVTINDIIRTLATHISDITVNYYESRDMLGYNLNTGAKSDLVLFEDLTYAGRYDYIKGEIDAETVTDALVKLFFAFETCICGRDYYNKEWKELGVKLSLVEKVVETKTTTYYK